jgi:hypothetical protein
MEKYTMDDVLKKDMVQYQCKDLIVMKNYFSIGNNSYPYRSIYYISNIFETANSMDYFCIHLIKGNIITIVSNVKNDIVSKYNVILKNL